MRSSDSPAPSESDRAKASTQAWTYCLEAYVNWSNRLSSFVTTEIIKHLKRHIRVKLLNYFIDAALECFNTGNFNSMMGILGREKSFSNENNVLSIMSYDDTTRNLRCCLYPSDVEVPRLIEDLFKCHTTIILSTYLPTGLQPMLTSLVFVLSGQPMMDRR